MALARSASGPGGLSINTNSANSLFGSSTTPAAGGLFGAQANKPATGLFGATTTTTAPQTSSLFGAAPAQAQTGGLFGSSVTTSQPQTGGLFGSTAATAQPQTGGLFGSTAATTQPQTAGLFGSAQPQQGGLFGNANSAQPAQGGGLFGSTAAPQPQQATGLFPSLAGQQNQPTGGGLFGNSTNQAAQGGGLFGGLNNQNQSKPTTSLFGGLGNSQNQQQAQPQQPSMFPSLNQNQGQCGFNNTLGGGLSMGQSTNQQQTIPGVRIDLSNIRGTTRFNDLHEDLQKEIEKLDEVIQRQMQLKNQCDAIVPAHESQLKQVPIDYEFCRRKKNGVTHNKETDSLAIEQIQKYIKTDAESAKLSFKAIDNLKLPPQYHNSNIWSSKSSSGDSRGHSNGEGDAQDIVSFFSKTGDELAATLANYEKHINEIELHLRGVESSSAQQINMLVAKRNGSYTGQDNAIDQLTGALRDFEEGLLGVASKVGATKEGVTRLQLGDFTATSSNQRKVNRNGIY